MVRLSMFREYETRSGVGAAAILALMLMSCDSDSISLLASLNAKCRFDQSG
jgi:hypothetical protein